VIRFDATSFQRLAEARGLELGSPLTVVEVTSSTNDDALAAARLGAPHGATFVAETQKRGRGRRGARWASVAGESLTFSVVLRPRFPAAKLSPLSLVVGLAVRAAAAARVAAPLGVKWPNDVVSDDKKLAGVLVESQITGDRVEAVIIGIGLNVSMRELPAEVRGIATSLALLDAADLAREALLVDLLAELEARLKNYEASGLAPLLEELRDHDALAGRRVQVDWGDRKVVGTARGIDACGALLITSDDNEVHALTAGQVRLLSD
jgi:BirA family biotin operon repressor/biotin-[acetyl-CoA-carboxylase] ligase